MRELKSRIKKFLVLIFTVLLLGPAVQAAEAPITPESPVDPLGGVSPDNTRKNLRDRSEDSLTPGDQSERREDRLITQRIRQAVVSREQLSLTAQNIKIITVSGVVTLRGPVKSEAEKVWIDHAAKEIAGVTNVNNQLEIAP